MMSSSSSSSSRATSPPPSPADDVTDASSYFASTARRIHSFWFTTLVLDISVLHLFRFLFFSYYAYDCFSQIPRASNYEFISTNLSHFHPSDEKLFRNSLLAPPLGLAVSAFHTFVAPVFYWTLTLLPSGIYPPSFAGAGGPSAGEVDIVTRHTEELLDSFMNPGGQTMAACWLVMTLISLRIAIGPGISTSRHKHTSREVSPTKNVTHNGKGKKNRKAKSRRNDGGGGNNGSDGRRVLPDLSPSRCAMFHHSWSTIHLEMYLLTVFHCYTYFISQLNLFQHEYLLSLLLCIWCGVDWVEVFGRTTTPSSSSVVSSSSSSPSPTSSSSSSSSAAVSVQERRVASFWPFRLFLVQVSVVYFWTGVAKLDSRWLSGEVLSHVVSPYARDMLSRVAATMIPSIFGLNVSTSEALLWTTMATSVCLLELLVLPFLLHMPFSYDVMQLRSRESHPGPGSRARARADGSGPIVDTAAALSLFVIGVGVSLHLVMEMSGLQIGNFSYIMAIVYSLMIPPRIADKILDWLSLLLGLAPNGWAERLFDRVVYDTLGAGAGEEGVESDDDDSDYSNPLSGHPIGFLLIVATSLVYLVAGYFLLFHLPLPTACVAPALVYIWLVCPSIDLLAWVRVLSRNEGLRKEALGVLRMRKKLATQLGLGDTTSPLTTSSSSSPSPSSSSSSSSSSSPSSLNGSCFTCTRPVRVLWFRWCREQDAIVMMKRAFVTLLCCAILAFVFHGQTNVVTKYYVSHAHQWAQRQDTKATLKFYRSALVHDRRNADLHSEVAAFYASIGELEHAVQYYRRVLNHMNPHNLKALAGVCAYALENNDEISACSQGRSLQRVVRMVQDQYCPSGSLAKACEMEKRFASMYADRRILAGIQRKWGCI
eukprot:TRINITY_DN2367_c1_g1_i1.p1 TRINITY_DN2367_c1_g1~~TRINITY_DN2367_c1_g1_i1.p1  ORF type:complete len:879 (+),score=181.82 TRINITY_DN2367_c1_g1_i1:974-3610(+)